MRNEAELDPMERLGQRMASQEPRGPVVAPAGGVSPFTWALVWAAAGVAWVLILLALRPGAALLMAIAR